MAKRKKKLERGIESLDEQIQLHKEKMAKAAEDGRIELSEYYGKEIESLEQTRKRKEKLLEKQQKENLVYNYLPFLAINTIIPIMQRIIPNIIENSENFNSHSGKADGSGENFGRNFRKIKKTPKRIKAPPMPA